MLHGDNKAGKMVTKAPTQATYMCYCSQLKGKMVFLHKHGHIGNYLQEVLM